MNKKIILTLIFLISLKSFSQIKEGQDFCDESKNKTYFPLVIKKKKIYWADTYYVETINGTKEINGKIYIEFQQKWKGNKIDKLYLREENGVVYQYEKCCKQETVRFDKNFTKGHVWKTADGLVEYKVKSFKGKLKTPFCKYKNLMVIEMKLKIGKFKFYYQRGHGYIGATFNNKLISYITPNIKKKYKKL